ncbi:sigma-70 family RNA polymerase sigma factor [Singulisphaera sp. PoT]|uniref:sigma-70 family RNA polymerase sigma factor n=1 Tax=Singulisphaera sp. PoT TaxID=3411797 RepID=UPI003BF57148
MPSEHRDIVLGRIRQVFAAGTATGLSEAQLLERFVEGGDELAFEALVERHESMVWGVCRRLLHDPNDAEDAFQATFLVMVRKAGLLRDGNRLGPWLYGVAFRTASRARVNAAKRRDREARAMRPEILDTADAPAVAELRHAIDEEIGRLPARYRTAVVLCHLQEKSVDEAASELGLSLGVVRGRLSRARKKLRAGLERRGLAPSSVGSLGLGIARNHPIPEYLAAKTTRFVLEASGPAALLAGQVASTMLWGQLKGIGVVLGMLVVVATAGVLGGGSGSPPAPPAKPEAAKPAPAPDPVAALVPPAEDDADTPVDPEALSKSDPYKPGRTTMEVVDADTGKPLQARMVRSIGNGHEQVLETDAQGRIDLEYSTKWENDHLMLDLWAEGHALQRVSYWGSEETQKIPNPLIVRLQKGQKLSGRFVNEAGEPVSGATIYLWSHKYKKKDKNELLYNLQATSGPDGRWVTSSAPEVTGEMIGIMYRHPEYVGAFRYETAPPIAEMLAGTARTVLKKGAEFSGRVLDMDGKPVEGAIVVFTDRSVLFLADTLHTQTDALGRFQFTNALPGQSTILIRAPGLSAKIIEREIKRGDGPIEIRMSKGKVFHGRVVDSAGRPINKAHFLLTRLNGFAPLSEGLDTDFDGRFHWDGAPEETMTVRVDRSGYIAEGLDNQPTIVDGRELVYRMARSLTIEGNITDAETGKPPKDIDFDIGKTDALGGVISWRQEHGAWLSQTGHYVKVIDAESASGFRVRIRALGYQTFVSRVILSNFSKANLSIKLAKDPHPGSSGVVLGPDGKPRAGARVIMVRDKGRTRLSTDPQEVPEQYFVSTGPDGRYQLPPTDDPYALAVVDESGCARYQSDITQGLTEIRLEPWARVEGSLPDGPLRFREFLQWSEDYSPPARVPPAKLVDASGNKVDAVVVTTPPLRPHFNGHVAKVDSKGRFVFEHIPPTSVDIGLYRDDKCLRRQAISPEPGETVQIRWNAGREVEP